MLVNPGGTGLYWVPVEQRTVKGEPVGLTEIARRLGVEQDTARQWHKRGLLPKHRWVVSSRPAWLWSDVEAWARETGRLR